MTARHETGLDRRTSALSGRLLRAMMALALLAGAAQAEPPDFDPNAILYVPKRTEVPGCGGVSFEPSATWEHSISQTVDGETRNDYELNAAMLARSETGLARVFLDPMVFVSVTCVPHEPYKGAAPDAERIIDRQGAYVESMVKSRLGNGRVSEWTEVTPISLPGTVSALIYFQYGGTNPAATGYLDIRTETHQVWVLFLIPTYVKPRKILPAGTVVSEPDDDGVIQTGRLISDGGISREGAFVPTRSFEDDISDIMRVFRSFRG